MSTEVARLPEDVARIALDIAGEAVRHGSLGVVLTGSHARGDSQPESDVDLYVIGDGPGYQLERRENRLVSVSWRSVEQYCANLYDPSRAGAAVPGWRRALIIADPQGIAADLRREATSWEWTSIGDDALNRWVAEEVTGFAEEVHKLVTAMRTGNVQMASVQRSILALRLAIPMSVHFRILYETENQLWEMVDAALGSEWTTMQATALSQTAETHAAQCRAALTLYGIAGDVVESLLDARQQSVVSHALHLAMSG